MEAGRPELALNLAYTNTLKSHDVSFEANNLNVNCWTPRMLLVATEKSQRDLAVETVCCVSSCPKSWTCPWTGRNTSTTRRS